MSAWHDNISPAALQRITTLSAFNDPQSKTLMLQTLYEELEKTIEDYKATNHELAQDYANLSKRAIKWVKVAERFPENCTCVLCALKDGGLETAYYEDGDFTFCAPAYHSQDVAAWAYIPEYKE